MAGKAKRTGGRPGGQQRAAGRVPANPAPTPAAPITTGQLGRWVIGIFLLVLPMLVVAFLPQATGAGGLVNLGILCAVAGFGISGVMGMGALVLTPVLMLFSLYVSGTPWLGTILMVAVTIGVAWAARRNLQIPATLIGSQVAMSLVLAPYVGADPSFATETRSAQIVAGVTALGALWGGLVGAVFLHGYGRRTPDLEGTLDQVWDRAVAMVVLAGLATIVGMTVLANTSAWWLVLFVFVLLAPFGPESQNAMLRRVGITLAVGLVAALVAVLLPFPGFTTLVGIAVLIAALVSYLKAPHWVFMALLGCAVIFLGFDPQVSVGSPSQQLAVTVVGALALFVGAIVAHLIMRRRGAITG